jgi:threonyl-tRNA synthetase
MKLLSLHCDYLKFKALKKALKSVEELGEKKNEAEIKEPLVVLTAIEKHDKDHKSLVENIKEIAKQVNPENLVLYPYAHLSSNLASPKDAVKILKDAEQELNKHPDFKGKVTRAPFGYYKEFELKVKGHPLSELSRTIGDDQQGSDQKTIEVKEESYDPKQLLNQISKTKLQREKLKDNDHRILAQQMDLFSFNETAPGMVFWHDNGLTIYDELINYWKEQHRENNYQIIKTPQILDRKLWQISGHWEKYKENIFLTDYEKRQFAVKPMNCPGGMLVFKKTPKSYKELPLRVGELGVVHRQELSGVLGGLFRVIQFTQDDAHIYCTESQMKDEITKIIDLTLAFYKKFNLEVNHIELSTRPEKRIGSDKIWDLAEKTLEEVLKKKKVKYQINKGDGAFYGPKIDFHVKDSLNRTWQCGTIQLDMAMPERFELEYINEKGKKQRPIMLHRTIYGSLERFIGVLLEHTNGRLPTWLAPIQVKLLSFTDKNIPAVKKLAEELINQGIRVETDTEAAPMGGRIRTAELSKPAYIVVIGDKEEQNNELAVRKNRKVQNQNKDEFIKNLLEEIKERK